MSTLPAIQTRVTNDKIKIASNIDLNALFNLNYNFDLLKGIIEELLKNQEALQNQMDLTDTTTHCRQNHLLKQDILKTQATNQDIICAEYLQN